MAAKFTSTFDNVEVYFEGNRLDVSYINMVSEIGSAARYEVAGYMDQSPFDKKGGEDMREATTLGSYGYAVKCLAEGLELAVKSGWLTDEEAKEELRSHVNVVKEKDNREAYIRHLEEQVENLKKGKPALMPPLAHTQ